MDYMHNKLYCNYKNNFTYLKFTKNIILFALTSIYYINYINYININILFIKVNRFNSRHIVKSVIKKHLLIP